MSLGVETNWRGHVVDGNLDADTRYDTMARGTARVLEIYFAALVTAWLLIIMPGSSRQTSLLTTRSERLARQLLYYTGTEMEFNFVLAVPIKSGQHSVTVGYFLEGNYDLPPYNSQRIYIEPLQMWQDKFLNTPAVGSNNRVHRAAMYQAVEVMLESNGGLAGRACLLRSICEAAAWPVKHDGLLGELLHVLLTGRRWFVTGLVLLMLASSTRSARPAVVSRRVRYLLFPPGSNMGIEAALSLPVRKNVNVAMNVEANYVLPYNITQFYPEYQKGSLWTEGVGRLDSGFGITRRRVYATIERFMTQFGLNGQACLLRAICETSESSLRHNGLFGDLLHIMFTPSSSKNEDLPNPYAQAEEAGTLGQDCSRVYSECTSGILQLFTMLGD